MTDDILNDYEHAVNRKIEENADKADFPKMEAYDIKKEDFDNYLFNKQAILDSNTNEKVRYTIWGILIAIPVLVLDAFPHEELPWGEDLSLFVGIGAGVVFCVCYQIIMGAVKRYRLSHQRDEQMERYIADVMGY